MLDTCAMPLCFNSTSIELKSIVHCFFDSLCYYGITLMKVNLKLLKMLDIYTHANTRTYKENEGDTWYHGKGQQRSYNSKELTTHIDHANSERLTWLSTSPEFRITHYGQGNKNWETQSLLLMEKQRVEIFHKSYWVWQGGNLQHKGSFKQLKIYIFIF